MDDVILEGCPFKAVKDYTFSLRGEGNTRLSYEVDYYVPEIGLAIHENIKGKGNAYMRRALLRQKGVKIMLLEDQERPNWNNIAENMPKVEERFKDEDKDFHGKPELYKKEEANKFDNYEIFEPSRNMTMAEALDMAQ